MNTTQEKEPLCRCRWCKRNDVPASAMAIYSWKVCFQMFTGVCMKCFMNDYKPEEERTCDTCGGPMPEVFESPHGESMCAKCAGMEGNPKN